MHPRRRQLLLVCIVCWQIGWSQSPIANSQELASQDGQPNFIVIVADDLGYGELGCQGNPQIPTPHIDQLAETGIRWTQAYVTAPNCSPSRAGLLTGRIPTRFGYEFNPIGARNEDPGTGIPTEEFLLSEQLHRLGYTTALIGKWHLGGAADYHPLRHGFDEFFGFMHEGHYFLPPPWRGGMTMLRKRNLPPGNETRYQANRSLIYSSHMGHNEPAYDANNPILRAGQPVVEAEYLTDAFTREAVDFIRRHRDGPFSLFVTYNAVHSPLQAKLESLEAFSSIEDIHRRIFAAMLHDLDQGVGRIVQTLEEEGIREKTMVVFLSDNGGPTKELTSSNLPLRAGKGSMYEGGLRVPFLVSWPSRIAEGVVRDQAISSMDLFPTLTRLAGGQPPRNLDGHDLWPLLRDPDTPTPHPHFYWRQGRRAAYREGAWKAVSPSKNNGKRQWELYNIESDIAESRDLSGEFPERLRELMSRWSELDAEMADPLF